jgi:hypothetical protein
LSLRVLGVPFQEGNRRSGDDQNAKPFLLKTSQTTKTALAETLFLRQLSLFDRLTHINDAVSGLHYSLNLNDAFHDKLHLVEAFAKVLPLDRV